MKRPEDVAREAIEANLEWYPTSIFGDDLDGKQWQAIRDVSPFSTERIAATCYRHAYRVALETVGEAFAEWREDEADAGERATPHPDTLAELLREHLRPIHVAGIPDRVDDLAHALTAAGVTYTPPGPAARTEELHRERLRYQLGAGNEAGVTITPPTTEQGHTAP